MNQQLLSSAVKTSIVVLITQPLTGSAQSPDRLRDVLTQALERGTDPQREPDWSWLRDAISRAVEDDPGSDVAMLAQRAAAAVDVQISQPLSTVNQPASLSIDPRPRFQIDRLRYVVIVEGSLDGGAWRALGWAAYPGGGCGTIVSRVFADAELRPGLHRLDVRPNFFVMNPRDPGPTASGTACGFLGPHGGPHRGESLPDVSWLSVLWRETRPTTSLTFGLSNRPEPSTDVRLAPSALGAHGLDAFEPRARNVSVRALDPRLPDLSLDEWLELALLPSKTITAETTWHLDDCRGGTADLRPDTDTAICAEAVAPLNEDRHLVVRLQVGRVVRQRGTWQWLETVPGIEEIFLEHEE